MLTQWEVAKVDDEDYRWLMTWNWNVDKGYSTMYASAKIEGDRSIMMHRLIMGHPRKPLEVDHIDHDRANNRWSNLRAASPSINRKNRTLQANNTSGCSGVDWRKQRNRWRASIKRKFLLNCILYVLTGIRTVSI